MTDLRISELPSIATLAPEDMIPVVDASVDVTKKMTIAQLDARYGAAIVTGNITGTNVSITGGAGAVIGSGVNVAIPQPIGPSASPTFNILSINELRVDSLNLNGSTISTTVTNDDLILSPNGTGKIQFVKESVFNQMVRISSDLILDSVTNSIATGADQVLAQPNKSILYTTNAGLTSIQGFSGGILNKLFIYTNKAGAPVTLRNAMGPATEQIITGTNLDLIVADNSSVWLYYASDSKFYVIGGSGGGGGAVASVNGQTGIVSLGIGDLNNVDNTGVGIGNTLVWDGTKYVPQVPVSPVDSVNGQTGTVLLALQNLTNVVITTPANGHTIVYQSGNWVNQALPAAPVDSVNGKTGAVQLDAIDIPYGITNVEDAINTLEGNVTTIFSDILSLQTEMLSVVKGPASATDNAIARYDATTGKLIQNSLVTISDLGDVAGMRDLTMRDLSVNQVTTIGSYFSGSTPITGDNSNFLRTLGNWTRYFNAGAVPTTGTGGSPSANFQTSRDFVNDGPLADNISMRVDNLTPVNLQGNGIASVFSVPKAMRGNICELTYLHSQLGTDYQTGFYKIFFYDVTNGALLSDIGENSVPALNGRGIARVYVPSTCLSIRAMVHVVTNNSTVFYDKEFKDFQFGIAEPVSIPLIGGWKLTTLTLNSNTGVASQQFYTKRVGQDLWIRGFVLYNGAGAGSTFTVGMPSGLNIDSTIVPNSTVNAMLNLGMWYDDSGGLSNAYSVVYNSNNAISFRRGNDMISSSFANNDRFTVFAIVPIAQWRDNTIEGLAIASQISTLSRTSTSNQGIANNTQVKMFWQSGEQAGGLTYDSINNRAIASRPMKVEVVASIGWNNNATGYRQTTIYKNGSSIKTAVLPASAVISGFTVPVVATIDLIKDDYLEIFVAQSSGAGLDVLGSYDGTFFQINEVASSINSILTRQMRDLEARSNNTVYQAQTDGFFIGTITSTASSGNKVASIRAYVGATNTPTTLLGSAFIYGHSAANWSNGESDSFSIPVKAGEYYKGELTNTVGDNSGLTVVYSWRPLGY